MIKKQALKSNIRDWNKSVFGRLGVVRNTVSKELDEWYMREEERELSHAERESKGAVVKKLWDLDKLLEIS